MKLEISVDNRAIDFDSANAEICEISPGLYSVLYQGRSYVVRLKSGADGWQAAIGEHRFEVQVEDTRNASKRSRASLAHLHQDVKAPMPGKVIRLLVKEGDTVEAGQGLVVVEAMKMQNEMKALRAGQVVRVAVKDGDTVAAGDVLVSLD
ncbi:MAG TPA: biotin/lipoyl-containing protein [Bryobacteraceae bacterium]|nr:biotin/lipoyl-containing protein [Bryobacteraceae bacterium]